VSTPARADRPKPPQPQPSEHGESRCSPREASTMTIPCTVGGRMTCQNPPNSMGAQGERRKERAASIHPHTPHHPRHRVTQLGNTNPPPTQAPVRMGVGGQLQPNVAPTCVGICAAGG
jgi:hypothetical protein